MRPRLAQRRTSAPTSALRAAPRSAHARVGGRTLARLVGLATLAALGAPAPAEAANVEFTASLDRAEIYSDETCTLTVTLAAPTQANVDSLEMPDTGALEVASRGSSTQMNFQFGSGGQQFRKVSSYTFELRAPRPGRYDIKPGAFSFDGQTYQTRPLALIVRPGSNPNGSAQQAQPGGRRFDPFGRRHGLPPDPDDPNDPLSQLMNQAQQRALGGQQQQQQQQPGSPPDPSVPSGSGNDDVFLSVTAEPRDPYVGQQVVMTVTLYSLEPVADLSSPQMPQTQGFWTEDIERASRVTARTRMVRGRAYQEYPLLRSALFPLKAGSLLIEPGQADVTLGMGFFQQGRRVRVRSTPVPLTVKPLPEAGKPPGFPMQNVGVFQMRARVDRVVVTPSQPLTLTLEVTGAGNIRNLTLPELQNLPHFRAYPPTVRQDIQQGGSELRGSKIAEYVLVPDSTGEVTLPPIELPTFNPQTHRYDILRSQPISVRVTTSGPPGASAPPGAEAHDPARRGVNVLVGGFRPIRFEGTPSPRSGPFHRTALFWALLFGPPLLMASSWGASRAQGLRERLSPRNSPKRAATRARKRLGELRVESGAGRAAESFAELARALTDFVRDRIDTPVAGLTRDGLRRVLLDRGFDATHVEGLVTELERCENARYAPAATAPQELEAALARSLALVDALERPVRRPRARVA